MTRKNWSHACFIKTDFCQCYEAFCCSLIYLLLCRSSRGTEVKQYKKSGLVQIEEGVSEQEGVKCHPNRDLFSAFIHNY